MQAVKTQQEQIEVRGARVHNLKNISLSLPVNQLTVFTGVSGSGKSSLAFDTLYAEGSGVMWNRCLRMPASFSSGWTSPMSMRSSAYHPLSPLGKRTRPKTRARPLRPNRDLRLPAAALRPCGQTICHVCGREVKKDSPESAAEEIIAELAEGHAFYVLSRSRTMPHASGQGSKEAEIKSICQRTQHIGISDLAAAAGFSRLFRDGQMIELQKPEDYEFTILRILMY
jgi:excinuclease ABC subunit A